VTRADQVWSALVALVMDTRQDWRRRVVEVTGLPFGRIRALRRLKDGPLALHQLAEAMTVDAPAATVAVNDLEQRGLVVRSPHPTNRRVKLVSLTAAGRDVVARAKAVTDRPPAAFAALAADELATLARAIAPASPARAPRRGAESKRRG
jgi:DNA-binding MarR family transcriptional regulator